MSSNYSILDVVPHGPPMSLLDNIICHDRTQLTANVLIHEASQFVCDRGVPAWVGIEYMGQAVAAFAGARARDDGLPVKIGFLVSSRRYQSSVSYFPLGATLTVQAEQVTEEIVGLGVFKCAIQGPGIEVNAKLNVYMPDDVAEFLEDGQ